MDEIVRVMGEIVMDEIRIEMIERYISEIEDDVPDVALAVKGFIGIWKEGQEHKNEKVD